MEKIIAVKKEKELMGIRRRIWGIALIAAVLLTLLTGHMRAYAAGGLDLSTDYPGISVKPGDSLSIGLNLENTTGSGLDADVSITSLPEGWEGYLQGGSYQVSRVHVNSGDEGASLTLHITVPGELTEGTYQASVLAYAGEGIQDTQTITFQVNQVNAGKGSFTSEYPEQEGPSGTTFSFSTTLINNGLKTQSYSLSSNAPAGWNVSFTPSGETTKVAAIDAEPGDSQGLNVSVVPPEGVEAGEYAISCSAVSAEETLSTDLKVVITGTYGLSVSTPDGRLSFDAQANKESDLTLDVTNTGNVDLENVSLTSSLPSGWTATFDLEDNMISSLPAGNTTQVIVHVKPDSDAITGDYAATFTASCEESSASADFRVSVKTSTLWGAVAVLVILCTVGGVGYVFRKYGRR